MNDLAGNLARMAPEQSGFGSTDLSRIFQMLFTEAAEGLVVVDTTGSILLCNPRLMEMFGYEDHELTGRSVDQLLPEAMRHRHAQHRSDYAHEPVQRSMGIGMDLWASRKDGSTFPVEISLNHFKVEGKLYVMGLVTDITLRQKAEKDLQRINEELEQRVEQRTAELLAAEQSVRAALIKERELHALKGRFVAMASHEFRTPLSTIMSSVDLIGRYTEGDEKVEKHVVRIRTKVRELTAMLNEFLSLERIDQGAVQIKPCEFDIVDHCIEQIEELRGLAKAGQSIEYGHSGDERLVSTDRAMLGNVITNLVTNAVKYSPEQRAISLRTQINAQNLEITVEDHGMGIPAEDQQHLFERFFRGGNVMTVQGTGLGLNLVKRYLELLGGTISFTSEPGHTVFVATLPKHTTITTEPWND
ncbi:MAG TPA: PAS domain-containing sensor histidine kinase [Flavobacteriales bacterium]|nr:PAS domain-containing sensor histidine kinase [Flavobacteriales bacterium]